MGTTRSRLLNKKLVSQQISEIAKKRKNEFGGITDILYTTDTDQTEACRVKMSQNTLTVNGKETDISCKAEARTKWRTTISIINYLMFALLLTLITMYMISYNSKNEEDMSTIKVVFVYVLIGGILITNTLLTFVTGHSVMENGKPNYWADDIIYFSWETKKKNKKLLKKLNQSQLSVLQDKLNLQHCKNIDVNECLKERVNKFYSLDGMDSNKFSDTFSDNLVKDKWEWKGHVTHKNPKKIDGKTVKVGKITRSLPNGTNVDGTPKFKTEVIESPYLLVGIECELTPGKDRCKRPPANATKPKTIDPVVAVYTEDPLKPGISIDLGIGQPELHPSIQQSQNIDNYTKLTQSTRCQDRTQDFCSLGSDKDGVQLCEWRDEKCKRKWKKGRGNELWSCDLCDDLSGKCSVEKRTTRVKNGAMVLTVLYGILAVFTQFIFKEEIENNTGYTSRSLVVIFSYMMTYYMGFTTLIFETLRLMCPDGSDMGILGRTDNKTYYGWWIVFNPNKTGEMFGFWRKEFKYMIGIIIALAVITTTVLTIGFGIKPFLIGSATSLGFGLFNSLMLFITSRGKTKWNWNAFIMSLFIGWGFGVTIGSVWSMTDKAKEIEETQN